jgi:hypothetical protein
LPKWNLVLTCSPTPSFPEGPSFPKAGANRARRTTFSQSRKFIDPIGHGASRGSHCLGRDGGLRAVSAVIARGAFDPVRVERAVSLASRADGYRFAKRQGKPNPANPRKARETSVSAIHGWASRPCVYAGFIAMLKLPFKFDRS